MSLGLLLAVASCVPPAAARYQVDSLTSSNMPLHPASLPTNPSAQIPTATEEPPPPEIMAEEIAPGLPASPFHIGRSSPVDMHNALECLTAAVYYEARSESEDGQRAVAQVVLNRVRHPAFPKSVCGVVYQGSNRTTGCQFTFTCDGSLNRGREPGAWARAERIAADALSGYVFAPVGLATNYHTTAIHPWWADAMAKAVTIGAHIFYRWKGEWGDPTAFRRPYVGVENVAGNVTGQDQLPLPQTPGERTEIVEGVTIHRIGDSATRLASADDGTMIRIHRLGGSASKAALPVATQAPEESGGVRVHHGLPDNFQPTSGEGAASAEGAPIVATH